MPAEQIGNLVRGEAICQQRAGVVPDDLLQRGVADTLHQSTFHLPAIHLRVQRFAKVIHHIDLQDAIGTQQAVQFHFDRAGSAGVIGKGMALPTLAVEIQLGCGMKALRLERNARQTLAMFTTAMSVVSRRLTLSNSRMSCVAPAGSSIHSMISPGSRQV
ncbi:MAG: hypothetical protein LPK85_15920, partial [Gammaproteobacteria bacterium]|nr:hypothetical protein [Gammaproteobacteria bacterium]